MPQLDITLIKGDRVSSKTDYRDNLPVNMYAVPRQVLGAKGYMLCWPGLEQFASGSGADRGAMYNERFGAQYRVSGGKLIEVAADGTVTELGDVSGADQAALPYSFNTQAVIADGRLFLYDSAAGFREVTDADLGNPIDGVWVDGYYFLTDGEYIYHTDISSESSIDPLKFATAEFMPDPSLAVAKTQDNKVIVFGRYTLEYFVNQALENFAFQRVETRAQKIGVVATHAKCEAEGNWYITGGRKGEALGVHEIGIGSAAKISTREVDKILAAYTEPQLANMRMETRTEDDVTIITIHLPNETLYFNVTIAEKYGKEAAWGILKTGTADSVYRAINGVFDANRGRWEYGDRTDGRLGYLDSSQFAQYDEAQEWLLNSPFVKLDGASIDELEIDTIPGNTLLDDATVAISATFDGQTYGKEWWDLYGEPLDYGHRFIQRALGSVDDWVGLRFRSVTKSRMAFARMKLTYG